jgi:parallel beta-helix repeat protein
MKNNSVIKSWIMAGVLLGVFAVAASAETFVVTSREDSGLGTLREAIAASNTTTGVQTITFNVPGGNSITVYTKIDITAPVIIDGNKTQVVGGVSNAVFGLAPFMINAGSDGSVIKNIAIVSSFFGIVIYSNNVVVSGCAIGTDWSDNNRGNNMGIALVATDIIVGGTTASDRNVISNNSVGIKSAGTRLKIQGNYIGTNSTGLASTFLQNIGIDFIGSSNSLVGGNYNLGEGNLISGNNYGIGAGGYGNSICGNIIGLNALQNTALPNNYGISSGAQCNIGLPQVGYGNYIAGNTLYGIYLSGKNNCVQNNLIGVNSSGVKFANDKGIGINYDACGNLIGGGRNSNRYERNVISGNTTGIYIANGLGNTVSGNYIGTDITGMGAVGNTTGIQILGGSGNLIGGSNADAANLQGNIISGQVISAGISLSGALNNNIAGNIIGLNANGDAAIPNQIGISLLAGNTSTSIGGTSADMRNVISGNSDCGIELSNTVNHIISGNYIGLNAAGTGVIKNTNAGIRLADSANITIGGLSASSRNLICGDKYGILINGSGSYGAMLEQNWLGALASGAPSPLQMICAISVSTSAHDNYLGQQNAGNLIVNAADGIRLAGAATRGNAMYSNTITAFSINAIWMANDGANNNMPAPTIYSTEPTMIKGTAYPNSFVEVFVSDQGSGSRGGSLSVLGSATADATGAWSFSPVSTQPDEYVCALATDSSNNTSVFSMNAHLAGQAVTPLTPTPITTPTPVRAASLGDNQIKALHNQINPKRGEQVDIYWRQAENAPVTMRVYNMVGDLIKTLIDGTEYPEHQINKISWSGRNTSGNIVGSGIYIVYIHAGGFDAYTKVAVVK